MRLTRSPRRFATRRRLGLSMVELLVGIAIGLFVLAGATIVVSSQLADNRRLLLETQVQQDLRAAADIVVRDLRRGGFWGNAATMVWPASGAAVPVNPYPPVWTAVGAGGQSQLMYTYSSAAPATPENDALDGNETFGFRLSSGTIEMLIGAGGWQALTDSSVLNVTQFAVQLNQQNIPVPCALACPGGGVACWPQQVVRDVDIQISAQAVHDATVQRSVRSTVRIRNDGVTGTCPAV